MTDLVTLLPPNHTPFEEALSLSVADALDIPVDLPLLVRPYEIPAPLLPWLAWGVSVDLWKDDWPEEKKRAAVARSIPWHKIKGTRAAMTEAIEFMGGEALRYIVPPNTPFASAPLTNEEYEDYLARFAQLRLYPYVERSQEAALCVYYEGPEWGFLGPINPVKARYTRTATLLDKGVETTLTVKTVTPEEAADGTAVEYDEVVIAPKPTAAFHCDADFPDAGQFLVDDFGVGQRIVRIPTEVNYSYRLGREQYTTFWPDGDLIDIYPRNIAEAHEMQNCGLYPDGGAEGDGVFDQIFMPPTISWRYLYDQWHIHDPERAPDARHGTMFCDYSRYGMPAYHAEVQTRIVKSRPVFAYGEFMDGFFIDSDQEEISDIADGIVAAKSLRDKIGIDTKTYSIPRVGDRQRVGTLKIGQHIEV